MPSRTCIDLREWAGKRYKWRFEESYKAEKDASVRGDGRWYVEILCKRGLIYPYGDNDLLAYAKGNAPAELRRLGLKVHQSGDRESTFRFPVERLDEVAKVLQVRSRRVLSPEQRIAASERLSKARILISKAGGKSSA